MGVYGVYTAVDDETFKQISFLNKEKLPVQRRCQVVEATSSFWKASRGVR